MIVFGKLKKKLYSSSGFNVYQFALPGGQYYTSIYYGEDPPEPLKTVQYQLTGKWGKYKGKKQFVIESYKRSDIKEVNYNFRLPG